jgi:hypothetical protein
VRRDPSVAAGALKQKASEAKLIYRLLDVKLSR